MDSVIKDPNAELDYGFDWSDWLIENEIIDSVEWIVPDGLVEFDTDKTATQAIVWLSGGTAGESYLVTCRMTTNNTPPRIDDRTFKVKCKER